MVGEGREGEKLGEEGGVEGRSWGKMGAGEEEEGGEGKGLEGRWRRWGGEGEVAQSYFRCLFYNACVHISVHTLHGYIDSCFLTYSSTYIYMGLFPICRSLSFLLPNDEVTHILFVFKIKFALQQTTY